MRPRVRECSLAHADSRDDKRRDLATDGQLADRDRLVGEVTSISRVVSLILTLITIVVSMVIIARSWRRRMGCPNELDRPVRGGHMYPGADDCPLGRVHRCGLGRLDD